MEIDSKLLRKHLVCYPDGGCSGTNAGAGMHGYFYAEAGEPITEKTNVNTPTTHGYLYDLNHERFLIEGARVVKPIGFVDYVKPIRDGTNNIGELTGAIAAIRCALETEAVSLKLLPDSEYVIKGTTQWLKGWIENRWVTQSGEPVKNIRLWQEWSEYWNRLPEAIRATYEISWVQGHSGNLGNDRADALATRGKRRAIKGEANVDEFVYALNSKYMARSSDYNRLLCLNNLYFDTGLPGVPTNAHGQIVYYCDSHGDDPDLYGKPMSDSIYSVVYLREPDPVLEAIRATQQDSDAGMDGTSYRGYLSRVFSGEQYGDLCRHGRRDLLVTGKGRNVTNVGDVILTREIRPRLLAWKAEDSFSVLRGIFDTWLLGRGSEAPSKRGDVVATDITGLLYVKELEKKKEVTKVAPLVLPTTTNFKVDVAYNLTGTEERTGLKLSVGIDLPNRTVLAGLAEREPKVWVLTWRESDRGFRYAVAIEAGEDVAIYAAVHANLHVIV